MKVLADGHVSVVGLCPLCHQQVESLKHVMCDCVQISRLWDDMPAVQLPSYEEDFSSWFFSRLVTYELHVLLRCVATMWCIWRERNNVVWNQKPWSCSAVYHEVQRLLNDWSDMDCSRNTAASQIRNGGLNVIANHLSLVQEDGFAIYTDAAVFVERDFASFGVVIMDKLGNFVAAKNGPVRCLNDVNLAEAIAIKEALSWAYDRRMTKVAVFSYCQTVCNAINGMALDYSSLGCVISQCRSLKRHFEVVSITFIPRSVNRLAHAMARANSSSTGPNVWVDSVPSCIDSLV